MAELDLWLETAVFEPIEQAVAKGDAKNCIVATDANDARASFSNFGGLVTIAAPSVNIFSLKRNTNQYTSVSRTSMACPHVAGFGGSAVAKQ